MAGKSYKESIEIKRLYKSRKDRIIDGICGGVAEYFRVDVTLIRILWVVALLFHGLGLVAYILCMVLIPSNPDHKNIRDEEKVKHNWTLFWGSILIILGLFFLFEKWHIWNQMDFPFYFQHWKIHFPWMTIWPIGLILLGVAYMIRALQKKREDERSGGRLDEDEQRFIRPRKNRILGGVCAGIATSLRMDVVFVRIGFVFFGLVTSFILWCFIYISLMIVMPQEEDTKIVPVK